ncbi:MAG: nitrate reductase cytochrome c-type subunit [Deltaproteobacteria bacterium]|nr:nitrate reductase cytochrome c-type subunit [Deltaproteobacteria bacterium]
MRSLTLLSLALLITACSGAAPAPDKAPEPPPADEGATETAEAPAPAPASIPESEIGLGSYDVFEAGTPMAPVAEGSEPGEGPKHPRAHPMAAPVIPHGVADLDPITRESNACVDCHEVKEKTEGEPTPMPPSHYTDLRNAPEKVGEKVAGARWVCISCHVARTDQAPLVGNSFGG